MLPWRRQDIGGSQQWGNRQYSININSVKEESTHHHSQSHHNYTLRHHKKDIIRLSFTKKYYKFTSVDSGGLEKYSKWAGRPVSWVTCAAPAPSRIRSAACVCSSFFLCTRRHPAHPVYALILHPREVQALWPQNYDTGRYVRCTR